MSTPPEPEADKVMLLRDGAVAEIVFNNPERLNAMSLAMWGALHSYLRECADDAEIRVVVLSGAGGRAFVSGADISEFETQRSSAEEVEHYNRVSEAAEAAVSGFPKPILAKIDGYCLGGGVGIAIGCDMRIASDTARIGIPAGRLGLGYAYDGVAKLIETIGPAATAEVFLTGRRFDAQEALGLRLVNHVLPKDQIDAYVRDLAAEIAGNAPLTMTAFKAALIEHRKAPDERSPQRVADLVAKCYASADYAEGRAAFSERRAPVFTGR